MSVNELDRCSHPMCENYSDADEYSDIASSPCKKCDNLMEGYPECRHCGQPGGKM